MSGIGNQPIQYSQTMQNVQALQNTATVPKTLKTEKPAEVVNSSIPGYPYGDDVFTGQFQGFKDMYKGLDNAVSKFSPFYGKMQSIPATNDQTANLGQAKPNLSFVDSGNNGLPNSNANNGLPNIGAGNTNAPASKYQQKEIPSGPVVNDLQQKLQQEVQVIQTPQKAIESVAGHAMLSRQERTLANDVSWGARLYAQKANELAQQIVKNKATMSPPQLQAKIREVENLKIKSVSMLNEAKKHAINTYTEAVKATLIYNNYFTEAGQFASVMNDNDRKFVESEIDKTWANWTTGFDKTVNGQTVHADEAPTIIDKANQEIQASLDKTNQMLAPLVPKANK